MSYEEIFSKQIEYINSLPQNKTSALIWYIGSGYDKLLKTLRNKEKLDEMLEKKYKSIQYIFHNIPALETPVVVYRGQTTKNIEELVGVLSTSTSMHAATQFAKIECCLFSITIPAGTKVIPVKTISVFEQEEEVLLNGYGRIDIISETDGIFNCVYTPKIVYELNLVDFNKINSSELKEKMTREKIESLIEFIDIKNIYTILDAKNALKDVIENPIELEIVAEALLDKALK